MAVVSAGVFTQACSEEASASRIGLLGLRQIVQLKNFY